MTDRERRVLCFFIRVTVRKWAKELKTVRAKYERIHSSYISVQIEHDKAVDLYESRIKKLRTLCENLGLSDSEIENLIKWHE